MRDDYTFSGISLLAHGLGAIVGAAAGAAAGIYGAEYTIETVEWLPQWIRYIADPISGGIGFGGGWIAGRAIIGGLVDKVLDGYHYLTSK
ncbi:hypothetical protein KY331_00955 [Candidatus Woesearchaeota archaeon]|nr:hypothetical protein [Candidatus Woesearchaeota archaeon]